MTFPIASLPLVRPRTSCAALKAAVTKVDGLAVAIAGAAVASASSGSVQYCNVTGAIDGDIGFQILLPTKTWRLRYLQNGCGGLCGMVSINPPQSDGLTSLAQGSFIVAADDEGHSGFSTTWAENPRARANFAYRSEHDLRLVSTALAVAFYGRTPRYAYYDGCSQGGHETLTEVQRYPTDFNGALAGAAAAIMTELNGIHQAWNYAANADAAGNAILLAAKVSILHKAVLAKCGGKAGLITDFRTCAFNPASVQYPKATPNGANCLSAAEVAVVRKVYSGPITPQGQKLYPGGNAIGSESAWSATFAPQSAGTEQAGPSADWVRYLALGKTLPASFTFRSIVFNKAWFDQIERLAGLYDATDPNLAPFRAAGGKLILWHGEADQNIPTIGTLAYYQAVVKAMGGLAATQQFARFYLLPAVNHCGGGGPDSYPGLAALMSWVEAHQTPNALIATQYSSGGQGGPAGGGTGGGPPGGDPPGGASNAAPTLGAAASGTVVRTLPLYPYPDVPQYTGSGNIDKAANFKPATSPALTTPVTWLGQFRAGMELWFNSAGTSCQRR